MLSYIVEMMGHLRWLRWTTVVRLGSVGDDSTPIAAPDQSRRVMTMFSPYSVAIRSSE